MQCLLDENQTERNNGVMLLNFLHMNLNYSNFSILFSIRYPLMSKKNTLMYTVFFNVTLNAHYLNPRATLHFRTDLKCKKTCKWTCYVQIEGIKLAVAYYWLLIQSIQKKETAFAVTIFFLQINSKKENCQRSQKVTYRYKVGV